MKGVVDITQKYKCTICGYIYDPEKGDADSGAKPGTTFEIFLRIGSALNAGLPKRILRRCCDDSS